MSSIPLPMARLAAAVALAALVVVPACGRPPTVEQQLTASVDRFRSDVDTRGVTLAVRRPGQPDVLVASGDERIEPGARFLIASVSKTFVAAAVHALVSEGKLGLDDTIDRWVPEVPNSGRITVRQLLSHTSGLTDAIDTAPWRDRIIGHDTTRFSADEAIEIAEPAATLQPGDYRYSNANYLIAGLIVERTTGHPLADELRQRFWQPLEMGDTSLDPDDARRGLVHGWFTLDDNGWGGAQGGRESFDPGVPRDLDVATFAELPTLQSAVAAPGGIVSSWADLLTWGAALADGRVLGPATDTMFYAPFPMKADSGQTTGWGLGFLAHACPCDTTVTPPRFRFTFHDGETIGSRTMFAVDRPAGTVIVIHANTREITDEALVALAVQVHDIVSA